MPYRRFANKSIASLIVVAGALLGAGQAQADPYYLTFDNIGAGRGVTVNYNGVNYGSFAGQLYAHLYSGPGQANPQAQFNTFCVDFEHSVSIGQTYLVNIRPTSSGLPGGSMIAYLYNMYGTSTIANTTAGKNLAAALQLAIWELLVDSGDGLSVGNFRYTTSGTVLTLANGYVNEAKQNNADAEWLDAAASDGVQGISRGQSFLYPAPEPSSLVLMGIGTVVLVGFVCFRRKRYLRLA